MDEFTRLMVFTRAEHCCEYCQIPQSAEPGITYHIEHVIAKQHRGSDDPTNLALACHVCNSKKGPNIAGLDPETGQLTRLFHPREDERNEHYTMGDDCVIVGLTDVGRTTVVLLEFNAPHRLRIRQLSQL